MRGTKTAKGERSWAEVCHWALVGLVLLSLVVTLATRFQVTVPGTTMVQASASQSTRQHMNQDADRWATPILQLTLLPVPTFYARQASPGPVLPALLIEESLYNRPPPAC
jgi:hypothetical protein